MSRERCVRSSKQIERPDTVGQPLVGDESTSQVCCSALNMTEVIFVVENKNALPAPSEEVGPRSV
jgi:hypothetical protein